MTTTDRPLSPVPDDPCYPPGEDPVGALIAYAQRSPGPPVQFTAPAEVRDPWLHQDSRVIPACQRVMSAAEITADRALWLEERRRADNGRDGARTGSWRLTASEMAAVLGLAPPEHGSAFRLYHEKISGESEFTGSARTDLGLFLEVLITRRVAAEYPALRISQGGLFTSRSYPWLAATFDAVAWDITWSDSEHDTSCCLSGAPAPFAPHPDCQGARGMVETYLPYAPVQEKTWGGSFSDFGPEGSSVMPVYYRVQCLVEMAVLGTERVLLPVLFLPSSKLRILVIERDAEAERDIAAIIAAGEEFISWLDEEQAPPVDWTPATTATLKAMYSRLDPGQVQIPQRLARRLLAADRAVKKAQRELGQAKNEVRSRLGHATDAVARDPQTGQVRQVLHRRGNPVAGYSVPPCEWREFMDIDRSWGT